MRLRQATWAFLTAIATTGRLVDGAAEQSTDLSFGGHDSINEAHVHANWHLMGDQGHVPAVWGDRIVLTPNQPGDVRGWMWARTPALWSDWQVDLRVWATPVPDGSGSLRIWYADRGPETVGSNGLYTVGPFSGLVVVIDQFGDSRKIGSVRAFINDGTIDYSKMTTDQVDGRALGYCPFDYRTADFAFPITIRNVEAGLEIYVNGKICVQADRFRLPAGYLFGATASSGQIPDSFSIAEFKMYKLASSPRAANLDQHPDQSQQQQQQHNAQYQPPPGVDSPGDHPASEYTNDAARFQDLHDRVSALSHQLRGLSESLNHVSQDTRLQFGPISQTLGDLITKVGRIDNRLDTLHSAFQRLTGGIEQIPHVVRTSVKSDLTAKTEDQTDRLRTLLQHATVSLTASVRADLESAIHPLPGFWRLVWNGICQGFGVLLVIGPVGAVAGWIRQRDINSRKYKSI